MRRALVWGGFLVVALAVLLILAGLIFTGFLYYQAGRPQEGRPQYVALGSSFAAGLGLGAAVPDSPFACQRGQDGYPRQLARHRKLSLVDMTCSGAATTNILRGGQVFLGPQINALGPDTELATLTSGGNDIRYVGDLTFMAGRRSPSFAGWATRHIWSGPLDPGQRNYARVGEDLVATVQEVRRRSPRARILVLTYPQILPPKGVCSGLQLTAAEADMMRTVGDRLAAATRQAAADSGAELIDLQRLGADHHACSPEPWVNGWRDPQGAPFHPTPAGAVATARAINEVLDRPVSEGHGRAARG